MNKYSQILILFVFYFQISGIKLQTNKEKDQEFSCDRRKEDEIDKSISKLIVVGQRNVKFPTNEAEVRPYCNRAHRTFEMVHAYANRCVPDMAKHTMKIFVKFAENELKGVCKGGKTSKRARELLQAAPCANAGLKNWQKCYQTLINKFTGIVNAPVKSRIPMSCCNFHQLVQCLTEEAEEVKVCTKKTVDYVTKYAHKMIDPIVMVLCNEYKEPSDRCDHLVRTTPKRTKKQRKYHSFLRPLINIAMSLMNETEVVKDMLDIQ